MNPREQMKKKKRVVVKIGSSSLTFQENGNINYGKIERLVRALTDLRSRNMDVVLVSSGAIAVGVRTVGLPEKPTEISKRQALAAIGQAKLMMTYQRLFSEYNQLTAQILMTKDTMIRDLSRFNAENTFDQLLKMGVIPVVNENDTVSTYEIEFGDNDRLSAIVAGLIHADLLILLSDIDGMYTDDPRKNPDAELISYVDEITDDILMMGKEESGSKVGTGGMRAKLAAARIATDSGADMVIANGDDIDIISDILSGKEVGTLFLAHKNRNFDLLDYIREYK